MIPLPKFPDVSERPRGWGGEKFAHLLLEDVDHLTQVIRKHVTIDHNRHRIHELVLVGELNVDTDDESQSAPQREAINVIITHLL